MGGTDILGLFPAGDFFLGVNLSKERAVSASEEGTGDISEPEEGTGSISEPEGGTLDVTEAVSEGGEKEDETHENRK